MILVYAGNRIDEPGRNPPRFPKTNVTGVRRAIRRILEDTQPEHLVGAAASGSDLIVLSEGNQSGIPTHIALPLDVTAFLQTSVSDQSDEWIDLFDEAINRCERLTVRDLSSFDDWYLRGNDLVLEVAARLANSDDIAALIVQATGDDNSATADFRHKVEEKGWPVIVVDPSDPEIVTGRG